MAQFGNRRVAYTPFFSQAMGGVSDAIMSRRDRKRAEAEKDELGRLAQNAFMGDPAALEALAVEDPDLALKVEDQQMARTKVGRETELEKDASFAEDTKQIMSDISQFETFEEAQAYGQRMTDFLQEKYPDRSQARGAPSEFTPQVFEEIRTVMGGAAQGTTVGVAFRATDAEGNPYMAQQFKLPNGGSVTRALKDPDGNRITPAEYNVGLASDLAGGKEGGKIRGGAEATIETTADVASATAQGAAAAAAQVDLPAFVMQAQDTIDAVDGLRNDPALDSVTGLGGWVNPAKLVPGTDAYDFRQRANQVQGKVFAQAYETLKGGGPITEIESAEAQKAIARMDTAQSKEAYLEALDDFENAIRRGVEKLEKQASGDFTYKPLTERSAAASQYTRNNPAKPTTQAERDDLPAGTYYRTPGGELRRKK